MYYSLNKDVTINNFSIFNRWGNLIYYQNDGEIPWYGTYKGQKCSDGTYFYIISYTNSSNQDTSLKGSLTIRR